MSSINKKRYPMALLTCATLSLAACGGGGGGGTPAATTTTTTATAAASSIVGTWARCNVTGATSNKVVTTLGALSAGPQAGGFSGQQSSQKTDFTDTTCQTGGTLDASVNGSSLYQLANAVTVDGTVAGITAATQHSGQDSATSSVDFDIIAANATQLFFGDKSTNTGATLALQPTQIETAAYTKQVALTSAALIGTWSQCGENDPADGGSAKNAVTFTATTSSLVQTAFGGTLTCDAVAATSVTPGPAETSTYVLGNRVTVNGTVVGIVNATQFNSTQAGTTEFDLIAIEGTQLVLGDTNGAQDGSTEALRATQLEDNAFDKE